MQEAIQRLDNSLLLGDYLQGVAYLRQLSLVRPDRIATLGFCTGGTYSMILAIHDTSLTCAVLCYVSQLVYPGLDQLKPYHPIDRAGEIRCPTLNVWGDQDAVLTPERRERLEKAFQSGRTPYEMRLYPGAGHAFLNPDLRLYHEEASRRAWPDILAFLAKHLKGR
jgi:carboxymethylenebutenolidase